LGGDGGGGGGGELVVGEFGAQAVDLGLQLFDLVGLLVYVFEDFEVLSYDYVHTFS
jgi:hypothetical protein